MIHSTTKKKNTNNKFFAVDSTNYSGTENISILCFVSNSSVRLSFFSLQMFANDLHIVCLLFIFRFKILCQYLLRTIFTEKNETKSEWVFFSLTRSLKPTPKDFRNENFTFDQHKHKHTHTLTIREWKKSTFSACKMQTIDDTHYSLLNNNTLDTND